MSNHRGPDQRNARPASTRCRCKASHLQSGATGWMLRLVLFALLAALVLTSPVQAQDAGVLEGQVVNGTEGGAEIGAGIPVKLYIFGADLEEQTLDTETDADGRFLFEGLDSSTTMEYWVEASYQDVTYGTKDLLTFADGQTTLEVTVTVYETTGDDSDVRLDLVHIFAESFGEVLRISETHLFGSTADRAYVGEEGAEGQPETVFIPLPADAVGFALGEGIPEERFVNADGGLVDSEPVRPGTLTSEVRFSYHLMATSKPVSLERRFSYPITNLTVLVAQPGLSLASGQVQSMGSQLIQDRQYEIFVGENLAPDTPVQFEFTPAGGGADTGGMPAGQTQASGSAGGSQSLLLWMGIGLALVAVAGAAVYAVTARRSGVDWASAPALTSDPKARRLLASLADLEDAFEEGEVDEASYERQRAEIHAELKAL
jgi:hypothetical protein